LRPALPCLVILLACKSGGDEEAQEKTIIDPVVNRVEVVEEVKDLQVEAGAKSVAPALAPVKLYLDFVGIRPMHKTFFTDSRVTREVQKRLQGHVSGSVGVRIDFIKNQGRIRIQVAPEYLVADLGTPEAIHLERLAPLTQAAAFYRDWVAGNFDLRVQNFEIGLDITPKNSVCKITVAGDLPPDGKEFSPCIEVDGTAFCGALADGILRLPPIHREAVAMCFF
jgi:hypothetical protein